MRRTTLSTLIAASLTLAMLVFAGDAGAKPVPPALAPPSAADAPKDKAAADPSPPLAWCDEAPGKTCMPEKCIPGEKVLIYFHATWCGPCTQLEENAFADPGVKHRLAGYRLIRVDIDKNPGLKEKANVRGTPTVDVVHGECKALRMSGVTENPKDNAARFLRFLDAAEADNK